jgi:hypothetical protein
MKCEKKNIRLLIIVFRYKRSANCAALCEMAEGNVPQQCAANIIIYIYRLCVNNKLHKWQATDEQEKENTNN